MQDPREILERLAAGNRRFAESLSTRHREAGCCRRRLAARQRADVALLCCSDARVPPEDVFDADLGSLFEVRTAGNLLDQVGLGSLEYACLHAGCCVVLVLGHDDCGAISAAIRHSSGEYVPESPCIDRLVQALAPFTAGRGGLQERVHQAARANVRSLCAEMPERSTVLAELVQQGRIILQGAVLHHATGLVEFLDSGPGQP